MTWVASNDAGYKGYNIYQRPRGANNPTIKVNPTLIPIAAGSHPYGATYTINDLNVFPGIKYDYYIEIIDAQGNARIVNQDWATLQPICPATDGGKKFPLNYCSCTPDR